MKGICPNCEKEVELNYINQPEEIRVRDENIPVEVGFFKCTNCGTEFRGPKSLNDPLEIAYREYRSRHQMLQPEEIKLFRSKYGLTQQELSNLLGWGGATLSRYENGALQDNTHDTVLKLIMEPANLLELINTKPDALSKAKREKLLLALKKIVSGQELFIPLYEAWFGSYAPSEYSGYKSLDVTKLLNAMVFFCKGEEVPKTKLNKLLFYADFKHYKDYTVSITGAKYAHLPFGPAPDQYQYYLASLYHEENAIRIEERDFNEYSGEYLKSLREPDLSIFSASELKILAMIKEQFEDFTASKISKLSHEEKGYTETRDGEIISYEYAKQLSI